MSYIIPVIVFVPLIVITVLLLTGHGANLIAGFNTLSKNEKEKYDKPALCRFVGKIMIPIEAAVLVAFVGSLFNAPWTTLFIIFTGVAVLPYIIVVAVYANTGNRFRK